MSVFLLITGYCVLTGACYFLFQSISEILQIEAAKKNHPRDIHEALQSVVSGHESVGSSQVPLGFISDSLRTSVTRPGS